MVSELIKGPVVRVTFIRFFENGSLQDDKKEIRQKKSYHVSPEFPFNLFAKFSLFSFNIRIDKEIQMLPDLII